MKITKTLIATLLAASSTMAAPARSVQGADILNTQVDMQDSSAPVASWIIEGLHRNCPSDSSCTWTFSINTQVVGSSPTDVSFVVNGPRANGDPKQFGNFIVTSGWSNQYGNDKGFTTLSTVDTTNNLIAFPSYTDAEVSNGVVVADRAYDVYKTGS